MGWCFIVYLNLQLHNKIITAEHIFYRGLFPFPLFSQETSLRHISKAQEILPNQKWKSFEIIKMPKSCSSARNSRTENALYFRHSSYWKQRYNSKMFLKCFNLFWLGMKRNRINMFSWLNIKLKYWQKKHTEKKGHLNSFKYRFYQENWRELLKNI